MKRIAVVVVCLTVVSVAGVGVASGRGSSPGKLCNKGKWQGLVTADGVEFQTQEGCTSYVQEGGALFTDVQAPCLGGAHATIAKEDGDPFADANDCLAYIADPANVLVICTVVGTPQSEFLTPTDGPDVFCGFGGTDRLGYGTTFTHLSEDDVYYGGPGGDILSGTVEGVFIGGDDDDTAEGHVDGLFVGGDGDDLAETYVNGTFEGGPGADESWGLLIGVFNGGIGDDRARSVYGTFDGGDGNDSASSIEDTGLFEGGAGNDSANSVDSGGTMSGGEDDDSVGSVEEEGSFIGGAGADSASYIAAGGFGGAGEGLFDGGDGNDIAGDVQGRFLGGADNDVAAEVAVTGIFYGGVGNDQVIDLYGVFAGEAGDDWVGTVFSTGQFYGGDDTDTANGCFPGAFLIGVENGCPA